MLKISREKDQEFSDDRFSNSPFGLSRGRGVYVICVVPKAKMYNQPKMKVVYIGSSFQIRKRLSVDAHVYRRLQRLLKTLVVFALEYECDNHLEVEMSLIKKYQPRFNRIGK